MNTDAQPELFSRLGPAPRNSGFKMDGWHIWCGSAIRGGDGKYHLFASRWPESSGFPEGYRKYSEIVRAVSDSPLGPYSFAEVVIGKRAPGRWDSGMAHNPAIYRVGDHYVIYYIGSDEGATYRRIGLATAPSPSGPWARRDGPLDLGIDDDANNPSACFSPDGSLRLLWRNAALKVCISKAPAFDGPFTLVNGDVWPPCRLEDFFYFKNGDTYQFVCEDNEGAVSGHERFGIGLTSGDGIDGWQPWTEPVAYDHEIPWVEGGRFSPLRRERPWLLLEHGAATHLFTGVWDGEKAWNQPVPILPAWSVA